jgi:hypothetical protein
VDEDGQIYCSGAANYPAWLRLEDRYQNFIFRFEYKMPYYTESGVFLGAPLDGRLANVGMLIKLSEDTARGAKVQHTGAIVGAAEALAVGSKGPDTWNAFELVMDWPRLEVRVNGTLVQAVDLDRHPELKYRYREGFVGFADAGSEVWFRHVRLRELPSKAHATELFNGKDLQGWETLGEARWRVDDGVIRSDGGDGYLMSTGKYRDFDLHLMVRTSRLANGGVFFRWNEITDRGYEIQVYHNPDGNNPTGSIYSEVRGACLPLDDPNDWVPMQIHVRDGHCVSRVNGVTVAESAGLETVREGRICLQMHKAGAWLEAKDIEIWPVVE